MAEPQSSDSNDTGRTGAGGRGGPQDQPPATPRWVKITGLVVGVFVLAVLVKVLFGGGVSHSPGLHGGLGTLAPATSTPASSAATTPLRPLPRP